MAIISLLDNDQYKFTMQQALLKLGFAAIPVEYKLKCRNENINFEPIYDRVYSRIDTLCDLRITYDEIEYLSKLSYITDEYLCFLKDFRFRREYVTLYRINKNELKLRIKGPWFHTILFEVPLLAIISEEWADFNAGNPEYAKAKLNRKCASVVEYRRVHEATTPPECVLTFSDFGTRRRHSFKWQDHVIKTVKDWIPNSFAGTSNVFFAKKYNLTPIGTMAHEWIMAHQQLNYRVRDSQRMAFENWIKVYRGDLGIALSDTINTKAFLSDFEDPFLHKLFDGVRQDSGDPTTFANQIINFYVVNHINPRSKTIVFSDSLNFKKMFDLHNTFKTLIDVKFGIGTNLTNDWDFDPLNIVIKMVKCNGQPVAKISNSPGKGMCEDDNFVEYLRSCYS